jgi:TolB-like protein/Tfp pilus assembly protein PilF
VLPQPGSNHHTATGTRLMTPEYASPEQWQGHSVGGASDIYSLGMILYRLLTGRSPYQLDSDAPHELGRAICEQDPEPPSHAAQLRRNQLAGDLDAIVLKALRKEPERRYRTVDELSEDLRRHLEGLPIKARPNGLSYRAARLLRRNRGEAIAAMAIAVLSSLVLAFLNHRSVGIGSASVADRVGGIMSLAVLPLVNLSRDPEQEFFADGMTDALIADLSRIRSLRVISRTSVIGYKNTKKNLTEIARELNVDGLVEGAVARSGQQVRITARLVRASDDQQMWAERYERELHDILALQSEVAKDIVGQIRGQIADPNPGQPTGGHVTKPAAYIAYVRGRYFWNQRNEKSLKTAITYFEEALKEDPSYAAAYSGLADSHFYLGYVFGREAPKDAMPKAKAAAMTGLALDESLAETHTSLALVKFFYEWDWPGAEREFQRAIELNPNYGTAHHAYAILLAVLNRGNESVKEARTALAVDPLSLPVNNILGDVLRMAGQYDAAIDQYRKTIELDPSFGMAHQDLGHVYELKGLETQAAEQYFLARTLSGESAAQIQTLRRSYQEGGLRGFRAKELAQAEKAQDGSQGHAWDMAIMHGSLGHDDEALMWLETMYNMRSGLLVWLDLEFRDFRDDGRRLRSDPRFLNLRHRIGLQP